MTIAVGGARRRNRRERERDREREKEKERECVSCTYLPYASPLRSSDDPTYSPTHSPPHVFALRFRLDIHPAHKPVDPTRQPSTRPMPACSRPSA
ncbi:hypothetical protein PMIN06_004989 [Paraphaeosphaeria minitans]